MGLIESCTNGFDCEGLLFCGDKQKNTLSRQKLIECKQPKQQLNQEKNEFDTINTEKNDFEPNITMREQNEKLTDMLNDVLQKIKQQKVENEMLKNELQQTSMLSLQTSTNNEEKCIENAEQTQPQIYIQNQNMLQINKQPQIETSSQISVDAVLNDDEVDIDQDIGQKNEIKVHITINNDEDVQTSTVVEIQTKQVRFYTETDDNKAKTTMETKENTEPTEQTAQPQQYEEKHQIKLEEQQLQKIQEEKDEEEGSQLKLVNDYGSELIFEIESDDKTNKYQYKIEKIGFKYGNITDVAIYLGDENEFKWTLLGNINDMKPTQFVKYYSIDDFIPYEEKVKNKINKIKIQILNNGNETNDTNQPQTCYYVKLLNMESFEAKKEDDNDELCTVRQLVWHITDASSTTDDKIRADILLLCHSVFVESIDLLTCLVERFNAVDVDGNERWNIQIKVGAILSSWMKTFWEEDFETKPGLMEDLEAFFQSIETKFSEDKRVQLLLKKMKQTNEMSYQRLCMKYNANERHSKDIGKMIGKPAHFNIIDQDAKTLAEQFTLMHFKAFKAITKRECLGQSWKKKDGSAQNILDMIKLFNSTVKWVQILILTQQTSSQRAKVMKLCIKIATFMKEFRNFSGSCAFHSALTSTPIHRLKMAWSKLSTDKMQKYEELQKIFGFGNNWKILRKLHRQAQTPAILHTGLFLQDLVGIDEGNINKLKDGKVNFKKLQKLHETIGTISMYQQEEYQFKENLLIQSVIEQDFKGQENVDDDLMFKMSSSVKASVQKRKQSLF